VISGSGGRSRESTGQHPYRDELLSAERLAERARELARGQLVDTSPPKGTPLLAIVEQAAAELDRHNTTLASVARTQRALPPAAEWLLDNYYLIEEQVRAVREDLPPGYGEELPWLTQGDLKDLPRVYEIAVTLVAHTDARIDQEYLLRFLDGFQSLRPLTIGEVWAVPIMLRVALVENLRRLALRTVTTLKAGLAADEWADRLLLAAQESLESLRPLIDRLETEHAVPEPAFVGRLSQRLQGQDTRADAINAWLERKLDAAGLSLDDISQELQQEQAADQVSIANTITAVRFLDAYDWRGFFEAVSLVEQILRQDPVGVYGRMDFQSRDRYRHALEMLARGCAFSEIEVAEATVSLAMEGLSEDPTDTVTAHVGHYLISDGRYLLERSLDYRPRPRERLYRGLLRRRGLLYWGVLNAGTIALLLLVVLYARNSGASGWQIVLLGALALLPLSDAAVAVTNRLAAWAFPARSLPKLDVRDPISEVHRTLVVVPSLLTSAAAVSAVLDNLEVTYLANRDANIAYGLLGDLRAADQPHMPADHAILDAARRGIRQLNARYLAEHGWEPFHLFVRGRRYVEAEDAWMGWERKRGSLAELCALLRGSAETSIEIRMGDEAFLLGVAFVLTLDTDTVLPRDGARKLISTIAHPLNRARYRPGDPRVHHGYGLVQPRVSMSLPSAAKSYFARLHSGITGIDPYAGAVSDTYQDVFGEGSFTGKGIFEVDVFNAVLGNAIPENQLLSHDLVEGCYLRTALASDIEVLDDYPASYLSHTARLHRWVRGDWQTLPWLLPYVPRADGTTGPNPLSTLHRWKIVDNLRRSLVAPALLLLTAVGWLVLPGPAWWWPLLVALLVLFPAYFSLADSLLFRPRMVSFSKHAGTVWEDFRRDTARVMLNMVLLPHQAWLMTDAIVRALWRMTVSHRGLLEWETAADVEKRAGDDLAGFARRILPASFAGILVLLPGALLGPGRLAVFGILAATALAAPVIAWRVSMPTKEVVEELDARQRALLRRLARRTWRFFETFVTADTHWLAPDNFQQIPEGRVAYRTSPTNIGLQLLSTLAAYDLGYLTIQGLTTSVSDTLNTMAGLERFRGHFYNWYDIQTLSPLPPNYVSTVDSGNLAGHLLVLRVGLLEASERPLLGEEILAGLADTAILAVEDMFEEHAGLAPEEAVRALRDALNEFARVARTTESPEDLGEWHHVLSRLSALADSALAAAASLEETSVPIVMTSVPHPATPVARVRDAVTAVGDAVHEASALLEILAPWAPLVTDVPAPILEDERAEDLAPLLSLVPSAVGLAEGLAEARAALVSLEGHPPGQGEDAKRSRHWAAAVREGLDTGRPAAEELVARLRLDADIAREMWEHTDFRMLFDAQRNLFSIGYNTAEGKLDPSFYDMLASECRLASFLSIAKGDVPQEHWFRLGRVLTAAGGGRVLLSWSASMFEYLMPLLVMRSWPNTLLHETYESVVRRQVEYGSERGVPWGVSESAFNAKDASLTFQYQAFGIPGLGLKRGLSEDVVIAPYATMLALPIAPHAVMKNLARLDEEGARGRYGFFEALDYTPGRIPAGQLKAVVSAFFAHHQGMSVVALSNQLSGRRMSERFHADPMVASADLLLQERVPRAVELSHPHVTEVEHVKSVRELPPPVTRAYPLADTPVPATHFLSNGSYSVMVTNGGGGYSRWQGLSVSRYREDVTRDCWGQFIYLRDADTGVVWSATANPCPSEPDDYHVTFSADKAEFRRRDGDLETHTEVAVSPEDDVEIRRVTVINRGREVRRIEATSYFEVALTEQAADQAHKSFSNLFVETSSVPELNSVLFTRRPRSAEEERVWGFHVLACEASETCEWTCETNRARFLGRLRGVANPAAVEQGGPLSGTTGPVLDPACSARRGARVQPGESARFVFATGVARERDAAERLCEKYHDVRSAQRAIDLSWTAAQIELRDLGITPAQAVTLQRLASRLLLTDPYQRLKVTTPVENGLPISGLWSIGISGDYPILLVRVEELEHTPLVRQALLAHQYWRHKGLVADLVILNTRPTGYSDSLDDRLRLLVRTGHALQLVDKPGGVFLRRTDQMHPDVLNLLLSVARATLEGDAGSIELQLNRRADRPEDPDPLVPGRDREPYELVPLERPDLLYDNGYGGFAMRDTEYVIILENEDTTPAPWVNVIATPEFGTMVSEAGIGCTWAKNSHENRITTWNNDPVADGSGEVLYLRDEETGEFWSPTPLPVREQEPYVIRHGRGYSRFEHTSHGVEQTLDLFVAAADPVRIARLRLRNITDRPRTISVTQFVEWVLGSSRSKAQHQVVTWFDAETDTLTAHNHYNMDFPGRSAFLACDRDLHSYTGSRTEFVGRNRRPADPIAMQRKGLGARTGRYHDNCGALMTLIELQPGAEETVAFLLGQTDTLEQTREVVATYRDPDAVDDALAQARRQWDAILGAVQVRSPNPALDIMVNGQALYQAVSCRLWGRTATYQSSGAFGFRDQLQDVWCMLFTRPDLVRSQIVEASRHQFPAGDVLHWWQPHSGRGVRTRITDDRHWLPLVTAEYVAATGDDSVLEVVTAFIEGPDLEPDMEHNYLQPAVSEEAATVYEHCVRALESGRGTGPHGLPLIGGGDWNDGMNRVGLGGRGESVWLGWFLNVVLTRFAPICELMGEPDRARDYRAWARELVDAIEESGWDGSWYRRAYFDDGTPLGTHEAQECRIDAVAQAWATICGQGDARRAVGALNAVEDLLVSREDGLIRLLTPPFDKIEHDPGYIKGYVPGVRENGGQYTHAAIWVVLAYLLQGDGDEALSLYDLINPVNHAKARPEADRYVVEPYVVAADVYSTEPHVGRGGWTWYTGSAGWFYRVAVQHVFGLQLHAEDGMRYFTVDPCIPKSWSGFELTYRVGRSSYHISVENPRGVNRGVARVSLDGAPVEDLRVRLVDDGDDHHVTVVLLGG